MPVKYGWEVSLMVEVRSKYREQIIKYLAENRIITGRFHIPLNLAGYTEKSESFPNANKFSKEDFVLHCRSSQPIENVDKCISLLKK